MAHLKHHKLSINIIMTICFLVFLGLTRESIAQITPNEKTNIIILDKPVQFFYRRSSVWVPAGTYRVTQSRRANTLTLSPQVGRSISINAKVTSHNETISGAILLATNVNSNLHLILLLPGGQALNAIASYKGFASHQTQVSIIQPSQITVLSKTRWTKMDNVLKTRYWSSLASSQSTIARRPTIPGHVIPSGPDLIITAQRTYFYNFFSPAKWTVTVTNQGNEDAFFEGSGHVIFGKGTEEYVAPGERTSGNTFIQPGQSLTFESEYQYYSCPRGGSIPNVKFVADLYNEINETNENNNEWTHNESPISTSGQPDLIVKSFRFEPAEPTIYDNIKIFVEMQNIGTGPAIFCNGEGTWRVTQKPEGAWQNVGHSMCRMVDPGVTFSTTNYGNGFAQPGTISPGSYPITVVVDPDNLISESNETNNTMSGTLVVQ